MQTLVLEFWLTSLQPVKNWFCLHLQFNSFISHKFVLFDFSFELDIMSALFSHTIWIKQKSLTHVYFYICMSHDFAFFWKLPFSNTFRERSLLDTRVSLTLRADRVGKHIAGILGNGVKRKQSLPPQNMLLGYWFSLFLRKDSGKTFDFSPKCLKEFMQRTCSRKGDIIIENYSLIWSVMGRNLARPPWSKSSLHPIAKDSTANIYLPDICFSISLWQSQVKPIRITNGNESHGFETERQVISPGHLYPGDTVLHRLAKFCAL